MANNDYLTINGSQVSLIAWDVAIDRCTTFRRGGIPELTFSRVVGKLAALPDTWSGKTCSWSNGTTYPGTTYFSGSVVGYTDRYANEFGWVRDYRALGLRNLADYVPVTDSNTLSDVAQFNMPANGIDSIPSRMGRTCGQAVIDVLSMSQNAAALTAFGIGNYTSAGSGATANATMAVGNTLATYGTITAITLVQGGSGYTVAPKVVIVGPCTTQATATCTVTAGSVNTTFTITNAGAGYTSPPTVIISTLPTTTITDIAALTVIPPFVLSFCGERLLQSVESIVQTCHPNHWLHVDATGTIRILDQRATTNYTVTMGNPSGTPEPDGTLGSRWLMPQLHRDLSDTYSRLIVRGDKNVSGQYLSTIPQSDTTMNATYTGPLTGGSPLATGGVIEDFTFSGNSSNSAAKAAWSPSNFATQSLQGGQDQGSCTCTTTTSVVITSSNTALTLSANQLDQNTGLHAILTVTQAIAVGSSQMFSTSVIANTAMTAGGTSTLTVAPPLPSTTYTSYFLTFSSQAGNAVWRRYLVVNPLIGAQLQNYFPYPFAYRNYDGTAAAMTSAATGMVLWSATGSPPYNESDFSITVNPSAGTISFPKPTSLVYGGGVVTPPSNIVVFVPIANGDLHVTSPLSGFAGTLYSVEGISRTKTITLRDWTQLSGQNQNLQTFADEQFDSIKDVVVEGSIDYLGLATTYLTPGQSVSITGQGYTTGWEVLQSSPMPAGIPVSSCEVIFQWGERGTSHITTLQLSNRRQRYTGEIFLRPSVTGQSFGGDSGIGHAGASDGMSGFMDFERESAVGITGSAGDLAGDVAMPAAGPGGGPEPDPLERVNQNPPPPPPPPREVAMPTHPEAGLGN